MIFIRNFKSGLYSELYYEYIDDSGYMSPESCINFELITFNNINK